MQMETIPVIQHMRQLDSKPHYVLHGTIIVAVD